jgi:hypothetical protein
MNVEPNAQTVQAPSPYAFTVNDEVLFDPTPKQLEALLECLTGKHPNLFIWGNRSGGKSWMARFLAHQLAMRFPGFRYKVIRRRFGELLENHLDYLTSEMEKLGGTYNKTEHTCHYANGSIGYYRQCDSDDDAEKALGGDV